MASVGIAVAGALFLALGGAIAFDVRGLGRGYVQLGMFLTSWVGGASSVRRRPLWARASAGGSLATIGVALIVFAALR